tara:strand:+ start:627 stop:1622 length:996 start_codon:yes stop_codon:yes gene_type:complete
MKEILTRLINHENLDKKESKEILIDISNGIYNNEQVASFLTVFMLRGTSTNELIGFRDALLELCIKLDFSDFQTIDLCGTGGDNKNTFNISTLASFVTAGAGIHVAKHGNYSVSSACGSSNVLEFFGIKFTNKEDFLKTCLNKANICILHAPLFHPAMKNVAPVRKALGMKTFFNILGPLVNPCRPNNQLVGVYGLDILRLYKSVFETTKGFKYSIIHSLDGYDEISLTGDTKVVSNNNEFLIKPKDFNFDIISSEKIFGGNTVKEAASIFHDVLNLRATKEQTNVVLANSALAISTVKEIRISDAFELAKDSLLNKKALKSFNTLIELSK